MGGETSFGVTRARGKRRAAIFVLLAKIFQNQDVLK